MRHSSGIIKPLIGIVVIAIGVFTIFNQKERPQASQPAVNPTEETGQAPPAPIPTPSPSYHPVSLQTLAQKKYDGRDLSVGRELESNADYTRFYITYKSGDLTISGIMNRPKGDGPFPVLILNHGYIDPAVYTNGRGLRREQDYFARNGYVVIHPDYRNHADSSKDPNENFHFRVGYIEDVINAVYAVKSANLSYIDKEKIGMLGHSMGGGITLSILTTQPTLVKAAVLLAPVSASAAENHKQYSANNPDISSKITELYGTPESNPTFWQNVSPENFLSNIKVPIMIHHGTIDIATPLVWSESLNKKLKESGKEVTLHVYPGEPHEFVYAWPTVMDRSLKFFNDRVKK